ncbi:MAG: hypothetical protein V6Z82_03960 [Flavobacteriales bacterium]
MSSKGLSRCFLPLILAVFTNGCTRGKKALQRGALIEAASIHSALIIETANLEAAYTSLGESELWQSIKGLDMGKALKKSRDWLEVICKASQGLVRADRRFVICAGENGVRSSTLIFYTSAGKIQSDSLVKNLSGRYRFSSYRYDGKKLFTGRSIGKNPDLYFSLYRNVFLFSSSKLLVEEGIRQLDSDTSLLKQPDFAFLYQTKSNSADINVFISIGESDSLLRNCFEKYGGSQLQNLADWAALDVDFKRDRWNISGVLQVKDSLPRFLNRFKGVPAHADYARKWIPAYAAAYVFYAISDYAAYYQNLKGYWNQKNALKRNRDTLSKWGIVPEDLFSWVSNGFVNFYTFEKNTVQNNLILPTDEPDEAAEKLAAHSEVSQTYRGYKLCKLNNPKLLDYTFGKAFSMANPHYFIGRNAVVFSGSTVVLKNLITQLYNHKTLGSSDEILQFRDAFATQCQVFLFAQNPGGLRFIAPLLSKRARKNLLRQRGMGQIRFFGLQLNFNGEQAVLTAVLKNGQAARKNVEPLWTLELGAPIVCGPFAFTNYRTRQMEIALQDGKNTLYLIDSKGDILWQKRLSEKIMGGIHEIDIYKNGKIQMVFNTATHLYVVARNGKDVKPFPIALQKRASAPMGLFDYDKSRNYRLLIPEGKNFGLYNQAGKKVSGFHFKPVKGYIDSAPHHFRIGTKDYIGATTSAGEILLLYRNGRIRVKVPKTYDLSGQPLALVPGEKPHWITTTTKGACLSIYPDGKTDISNLKLKTGHGFRVVGKGVVFRSGDELRRMGNKGFTYRTSGDLAYLSTGKAGRQRYYAATDRASKQVYLIDSRGKLVKSFPVYGDGKTVILDSDGDANPEVVVGTAKGQLIFYGN